MTFQPQKQSSIDRDQPSAIGGIDATQVMSGMAEDTCIYTYNLMPKDFGMNVRSGYREWANGVTGADGTRTMMGFYGLLASGDDDRLFACTSAGIFDVTDVGTTAPIQVVTWPVQSFLSGLCIFVQFTTAAGAYLLVCDGENGYWTYEGATQTWTEVPNGGGGITGPADARDLVFVTVWKNRVWFVEKESGTAWYLPTGSFLGTATEFEFGNKFRYGSELIGLWNWTLDGGNGVDDFLVIISRGGDVIVYEGTDPASANDFGLVGSWFVGAMPVGRRVASDFGGDLLVLSTYGVTSMAHLLGGTGTDEVSTYITSKVAPYVRQVMDDSLALQGWEINSHPRDGLVIIDTPSRVGKAPIQFVMNIGTHAWGIWRDVPISTLTPWRGELYFGSQDHNSIWQYAGTVDRVFLDPETDGNGVAINFSTLFSFSNLDHAGKQKIIQFLRPVFNSTILPAYEISARFDFNLSEIPTGPVGTEDKAGVWDISIWDDAVWGGGFAGNDNPRGGSGMGRYVAVALRGSSTGRANLLAINMVYTPGWFL